MNAGADRVATGVPGLDTILGGGPLPGTLVFVVGVAGVGKTVLAQQMAFHSAAGGVPVVYFTALSEPHDKLLRHLQGFRFFDPAAIGQQVQLLNLEQVLQQGTQETTDAIVQAARGHRAGLVVIDAFRSIGEHFGSAIQAHQLLYQLSGRLSVIGARCVVTFEADPWDRAVIPDLMPPDAIVALQQTAPRAGVPQRRVQVLKARGSDPLPGEHSMRITADGVRCYPQAEALPVRQPTSGILQPRAAFGIPALDALLGGGPTEGTSTLVAGSPGSGQTLLALSWLLEGAAQGQPGLLAGFHESAQQLIDRCNQFGLGLGRCVENGTITLWTQVPAALDGNVLAAGLRERIAAHGVRRLAIDSARELGRSVEPARADDYLSTLIAYLQGEEVSTLLTYPVSSAAWAAVDLADTPMAVLAENLLLLQQMIVSGRPTCSLRVLKMRFSAYDANPYTYEITDRGFAAVRRPIVARPDEAEMTDAPADAGDGRDGDGADRRR